MKKSCLLLTALVLVQLLRAQSNERVSRVRIDLRERPIAELAALGIEADHGKYEPGRSLTTELSVAELQTVRQAGFQTEILIPDMQQWRQTYHGPVEARGSDCSAAAPATDHWKTPLNYKPGSMGGFATYAEMLATLDEMHAKFPNLVSARAMVSDTMTTHEGRPLWWVRISDNAGSDEPEPEMLYNALHHAREPNGMSQMLFYMWYLLENYASDPEIRYLVDHTELYFIPCVNPDGYLYNEFTDPAGGGFWRKNRRDNGDGTVGVDLNRNYGYQWGVNNQGSSPDPSSNTYRGPAAFSEPETRMLRDFCLQHNFKFALNYHTYGNLLIYPWAYSDQLADPALADFARLVTQENQFKRGTSIETVGYRVNGSSDDWMFGAADILSFTSETGPGDFGFWPPADVIDQLNKQNMWQNLAPAFSLLRFGVVTDRGGELLDMSQPKIEFHLTRYGFEDSPLTVSLQALTPNVQVVGAPLTYQLSQFGAVDSSFAIQLAPGVLSGSEALFVLQLDNGKTVHRDTLRKVLQGPALLLFSETGEDPGLAAWSVDGTWGTTFSDYISAPSSITDSPDALYAPNTLNILNQAAPVTIPASAQSARLRFWTHWSVEKGYDYVLFNGSGATTGTRALCGRYTTPGTTNQTSGDPVYDGLQDEWVEESMDLSDFIGDAFSLQIVLVSDGFQEFDGFYFDDMRIEYTEPGFVGVVSVPAGQFAVRQNTPNPANGSTLIAWDKPVVSSGPAQLEVYNVFGEKILEQALDVNNQTQFLLDTRTLAPGPYAYCLRSAGGQSTPRKMTVLHP